MNEVRLGCDGAASTLYYEPEGLLLQAAVLPRATGATLLTQVLYLGDGVLGVEIVVASRLGDEDGDEPALPGGEAGPIQLQGHDEKHAPGGWLTFRRLPADEIGWTWIIRSLSVDHDLPRGEIRCEFRGSVADGIVTLTYAGATRPAP